MPFIAESHYRAPLFFRNGHISTLYGGLFEKTVIPEYQREKLVLPDGDFLLVDFIIRDKSKAVVLCHGLEGDSRVHYNNTCAQYFLKNNFSVFAWNNRSCGGQMNLLPQLYHHGSIEDLGSVVDHILELGFSEIYLIGFSLGGAQILNYFGRKKIDSRIRAGVAVSTPVRLNSSFEMITHGFNKIYRYELIKNLKKKLILKSKTFPSLISQKKIDSIHDFQDYAKYFLAPVHGFTSLEDYFERASPAYSLEDIHTPVLILNALDDPIIGKESYPVDLAKRNSYIYLETPAHGGHCAFPLSHSVFSYSEIRALGFFRKINGNWTNNNI